MPTEDGSPPSDVRSLATAESAGASTPAPRRPVRRLDSPPDEALLQAHVEGDPQAFNELVRRHRSGLWGIALRILRHQQDAEDATQSALIRAFERAATFKGDSDVRAWLRAIVSNTATTMAVQRARARARTSAQAAQETPDQNAGDAPRDVELQILLHDALLAVPEVFRPAFFLVALRDLSIEEVAELEGVRPGTIKSRVSRARALLVQQVGVDTVLGNLDGA